MRVTLLLAVLQHQHCVQLCCVSIASRWCGSCFAIRTVLWGGFVLVWIHGCSCKSLRPYCLRSFTYES
jgi:hypothetical protein